MESTNGNIHVGDTVYFWHDSMIDEGEVVMFGGDNQVIVQYGDKWLLFNADEVKLGQDVTDTEWNQYNFK